MKYFHHFCGVLGLYNVAVGILKLLQAYNTAELTIGITVMCMLVMALNIWGLIIPSLKRLQAANESTEPNT
jgi:hypothetical protein